MIFIFHYICFDAGLSSVIVLLALFLQTYSDASLTEIGTLLMALPFVSIIVKPLFCALADRHRAHKNYLIGSILVMALGYGSLTIAPFFPDFISQHGRLVWYLDIVGVVIGFSAFGIVWSLGDAMAVNAARAAGVPWGSYRAWATVSWGVFGWLIGQINEMPGVPKYVPGVLVMVAALTIEIILLCLWPNEAFDMATGGQKQPVVVAAEELPRGLPGLNSGLGDVPESPGSKGDDLMRQQQQQAAEEQACANNGTCDTWPANRSLTGSLSGSARLNPKLMGAVANIFMEDIGSSLKSSLRIGQPPKRMGLADILEQHQLIGNISSGNKTNPLVPIGSGSLPRNGGGGAQAHAQRPASPLAAAGAHQAGANLKAQNSPISNILDRSISSQVTSTGQSGGASTMSRLALRRAHMALARMNSLSSASGHAIADEFQRNNCSDFDQTTPYTTTTMVMSSLTSNASLSKAAAARAIGFVGGSSLANVKDLSQLSSFASETAGQNNRQHLKQLPEVQIRPQLEAANEEKSAMDLQLVLLKLIIKRDASIFKNLIMFTLYGFLLFVHITYFFMHVERLCHEKGYNFSEVIGAMLVAQSISEVFSFIVIVPYFMPRVGRIGSMLSCSLIFAVRYAFYGTYYSQLSPYTALATEVCHGFAYGIAYTLITDIAVECVDQVDLYLPELIQRGIVHPHINPIELKLPLRATMQGVFSGAFDGLGAGVGALFAGIYLDSYSYSSLWLFCTYVSLAIAVIYPLTELSNLRSKGDSDKHRSRSINTTTTTLH